MRPLLSLFLCFFISLTAEASLRIEIRQGMVKKTPVAIVAIPGETTFDKRMKKVIDHDFKTSGLFKLINEKAFIQGPASLLEKVRFADWRVLKAQFLLTINVSRGIFSGLEVTFKLYDVMRGQEVLSQTIKGDQENWRRLAHIVADKVYHRITGEDGYFSSRIAYVKESGPRGAKRRYRLAIMDSDGYNNQFLTETGQTCIMPRFSKDGKKLTYVKFVNNRAHVYMIDMATGQRRALGYFSGVSFSSRFSPDGQFVAMSVAERNSSHIVLINTITGEIKQLTPKVNGRIDVSPCFSPNGKEIYFTSDRYGQENIYLMDLNGKNIRHISVRGGKYSQPVISPRGDKIAFTKQIGNRFAIGIMNLDGTDEYMILQGNKIQDPAWTPNGRYISFTKLKGRGVSAKTHLMMVDLTGRNLRKIPTDGESSGASWSPPASVTLE